MKKLFITSLLLIISFLSVNIVYADINNKELESAKKEHQKANAGNLKAQAKAESLYLSVVETSPEDKGIAYRLLGELYLHTPDNMHDYEKAYKYYTLAEENISNPIDRSLATYNLGLMHYNGKIDSIDFNKAYIYFSQAAEVNDKLAISLGEIAELGIFNDVNLDTALDYYYTSASAGNEGAWPKIFNIIYVIDQTSQGTLNEQGYEDYKNFLMEFSVKKNYEEAKKYLFKSADEGFAIAMYEIGTMHMTGNDNLGIKANGNTAIEWLEKAVENGFDIANHNIGIIYNNSLKTKKAIGYFEKSAKTGLPHSQFMLGQYYYLGAGGYSIDYEKALIWYEIARDQGFFPAQEMITNIELAKAGLITPQKYMSFKNILATINEVAPLIINARDQFKNIKNSGNSNAYYNKSSNSSPQIASSSNNNQMSDMDAKLQSSTYVANHIGFRNSDQRVYQNYVNQLIDMNTYLESRYNDSARRNIQISMKGIRNKWANKGNGELTISYSDWEDWNGRKR